MPLRAVRVTLRFAALVCGRNKFMFANIVFWQSGILQGVVEASAGGLSHTPLGFVDKPIGASA